MAAVLVFLINAFIAVKTASYGIWEAKRNNLGGGVFVIILAAFNVLLAGRYLIKYWT